MVILWVSGEIASTRRGLLARSLLRDGEVTTGIIIDRHSGHNRIRLDCQYGTRMGQKFENRGEVVSERKLYQEKGLVPVFYRPEDPTKSIALCCTVSRVRTPGEESFSACQPSRIPS
jgi:hypothetical protein